MISFNGLLHKSSIFSRYAASLNALSFSYSQSYQSSRFLPQNASSNGVFAIGFRQIVTFNKAKRRRRRIAGRQKRREDALKAQDWPIRSRDTVFVLNEGYRLGNAEILKDKSKCASLLGGKMSDLGTVGKVKQVHILEDCLTVKGVNVKQVQEYNLTTGLPAKKLKPLPVAYSRCFLIDPSDGLPTLTKYMYDKDSGKKYRVSIRSGEIIPRPEKTPVVHRFYPETDTTVEDALEVTYNPEEKYDYKKANEELDEKRIIRKQERLKKNIELKRQTTILSKLRRQAVQEEAKIKYLKTVAKQKLEDRSVTGPFFNEIQ